MNKFLPIALVAALSTGVATADRPAESIRGTVDGQVTGAATPLPLSKVYVYHLTDQSLRKAMTGADGQFRFDGLPAGLYKVIAYKDGFVPAIALLSRSTRQAHQFLKMDLVQEDPENGAAQTGFWAVREKIPSDVLRDIETQDADLLELAKSHMTSKLIDPYQFETRMQAIAGLDDNPELGSSSMTGGRVGVRGEFKDFRVQLKGDYIALQPVTTGESAFDSSGRTQSLSVSVDNQGSTGVRVSTTNNYMSREKSKGRPGNYVGLERHQVSWTQDLGSFGRSSFSAEYAEESNFFRQAPIEPYGIPSSSRLWRVQGSHQAKLSERATLETGFRYRERQSLFEIETRRTRRARREHEQESPDFVPAQRVDLFSRSGWHVNPDVLVEFGLYSTLRDGSLSLAPSGGLALQLSDNWRAQATGMARLYDDDSDTLHNDFNTALFADSSACQTVEEYCYRLKLAHQSDDLEDLSVGVVHRRYAETLHMYFNKDFFSRLESLYLVDGDEMPEVQFAAAKRFSPKILARLASNVAAGGGGLLYATDRTSYENQVRYMVTSLDTHFEQTSTGVFVAFHHIAQQLNPLAADADDRVSTPEIELDRLQVMLTQDLDILSRLASDWAVHLNMELSRGTSPETDSKVDGNELRQRVTGGVSVSF